jgi:catechol 2,3-dioxygenase-like lactoylglutathione lyase family enzyme
MKNKYFKTAVRNLWLPSILLAVVSVGWSSGKSEYIANTGIPVLINTCLFTNNVSRLVNFYEPVLGMKAKRPDETYAEFPTGVGVLAIFSHTAQEKYIPGSTGGAKNGSIVLEFKVANVDTDYRRLQRFVKTWVKPPTTQPWGTRSIYFRDPDGNLVDFYTIVKTQ